MARATRVVVQAERLRDQVYQLIREDLKSGELAPGQRLVEVDLAEKYGVSRTPIREALFQLTRAGFLESSERGYSAPVFSEGDLRDRLEVKRALLPAIAAHVAESATPAEIRKLARDHEKETAAHAGGAPQAFIEANNVFRADYYAICRNMLLARCALMVEDQFDAGRNRIHLLEENRGLSLAYDGRLLAAIAAHDAPAATAEVSAFLAFLDGYFAEHPQPA
jgi:DNA-binding GntR family transcriptional regulator